MRKILILLLASFCTGSVFSLGKQTLSGIDYVVDTVQHYQVGPGTVYTRLHFHDEDRENLLQAFVYEVTLSNPYVKLKSETAFGTMKGVKTVSAMAKENSSEKNLYFAGVNGDFFDMGGTGEPVNGFITERKIGTIPISSREVFSITEDGIPFIEIMSFDGFLKHGENSLKIDRTNAARGANQLLLYNELQGSTTGTNIYGTEILVELVDGDWLLNSGIKKVKVIKKETGVGGMTIAENCVVLSGNGSAKAFLDTINEGDILELTTNVLLSSDVALKAISEVIGGDRLMLKNGAIAGANWVKREPRTGVGFNADKSKVYFAVVDGRSVSSVGVSTHDFGEILRVRGVSDALNLDGGGSSTMYFDQYGVVNSAAKGQRNVSNGMYVVSSAPSDENITSIGFTKSRYVLPVNSKMKPTIVGYNKYGHIIATDLDVKLSCPPTLGQIQADVNLIVGEEVITENLMATYNGITASVPVAIINEGINYIVPDSVILDLKHEYIVDVNVNLYGVEYPMLASSLTWSVEDNSICSIDKGSLRGLKDGRTKVFGEFNGVVDSLEVIVQPVIDNPYIQTQFENAEDFHFTRTSSNLKDLTLHTDIITELKSKRSVSFTYQKGRGGSFVYINYVPKLYSLPDSLVFTFNVGNTEIISTSLMFQSVTDKTEKKVTYGGSIELEKDIEFTVNLNDIYDKTDIAQYPIDLLYVYFALNDSKLKTGTEYNIYLKDIKLFYDGYPMGIEEFVSESGNMFIQPNPVKNGEAIMNFTTENQEPLRVDIYSLSGQLNKTLEFEVSAANQYILPVQDLGKGVYLVSVTQKGGVKESVKMIVE